MQTSSIEWLEEKLDSILPLDFEWYKIEKAFEKAKEMHKEEIENTYWSAYKEGQHSGDKTAEEYYQETFNQNKL